MAALSTTPGVPSAPSRERLHRRQRSHPFLNLTFTALHESPALSSVQNGPNRKPSSQATYSGATGSTSTAGFGTSALVTGYDNDAPSQERKNKRTSSSGSLSNLPNFSSGERRPARSLPSSPGRSRRPSLPQQNGLDPRKEYFFTPSSTPIVLPPTSPPDPLTPRMRKRSTGAKSAPTSPVNSLTPVGSRIDLVAYAEKARLARSGSVGEAMHALRNQQWVGQSSRAGAEFPAGGHFFPSRTQYNNAEAQYASPDEESQDEADSISVSRRKASRGSARSSSNPVGGALDIRVDATPALSRRQSEATLRAHSIQTTPQPEQVMDTVPLPATTSTDNEIDQKTISILYALRYLAAIPVIQTAVSNMQPAVFARSSGHQTHHGLISLWATVTAFALVNLTSDLLRRWLYNCRYPPFPHILIRLLALQLGILFPSIHLALAMLNPNPADKVSSQAVVAWCFVATTVTVIGDAIRPWTRVTTRQVPSEHKNAPAEKLTDSSFTTDEPRPSQDPLRFHLTRLRSSVGGPLFPTIFAYFLTSWVLLLT
ncbi:hypothetical protein FS837_009304 [Tulasnella sp. UAMH 9824]|nr:hypothetical protein FS837_009304 [Tulasnella sp. UAMH 9824]